MPMWKRVLRERSLQHSYAESVLRFTAAIGISILASSAGAAETQPAFGVPLTCDPQSQCLVQQFPDMQEGPGVSDPFCGGVTYDGHNGTDIRIRSLKEMDENVPVLAMAAGRILRSRDGEPDRLAGGKEAANTFDGKECGNGLVIDHGDGWESQYCHLKKNSLVYPAGATVTRGETIGFVGSSGWAQFPHVHVTVRHRGVVVDPATGGAVGSGCIVQENERKPLWGPDALQWLKAATHSILDIGLSGSVIKHDQLVTEGGPPPLAADANAVVGWAWFSNLEAGDQVRITIIDPSGTTITENVSDPLTGRKASYSQFAGRKRKPMAGPYRLMVELLRGGAVLETRSKTVEVKE